MPRPKKQPNDPLLQSLEELISDYSRDELSHALADIQNNLGWKVLRAALMKEYVSKMVYIMDYSAKTGKQIEAAAEAGTAKALYDIATALIPQYIDILQNKVLVTESPRPEE